MKILIVDYSGHPFPVQLSRALAGAGHEVLHLFTGSSETPKGDLVKHESDPASFDVRQVSLDETFNKTDLIKRLRQERQIGQLFAAVVLSFRPHFIIAGNCPIETLKFVVAARAKVGARFVFWVQDLLGEAASRLLTRRLGIAGQVVGQYFQRVERRLLRSADHVVAIADDFIPVLRESYGIDQSRITVIENWAPIDDIPLLPRDSAWARRHLSPSAFRIIYSGTLGLKQDPAVLLLLAGQLDCQVLVFSEGVVARQLAADAAARGIGNLEVRPWLAFADLAKALAAADLLVVLLEPDAGAFSVPSKVLGYLCSGRPILGSINRDNLAARIIERTGAGVTVTPGDHPALLAAARAMQADPATARAAGLAGRRYAEQTFDIEAITAKFLQVIDKVEASRKEYA